MSEPAVLRKAGISSVMYDVPLVKQQQSPICWIASMAMVASWKRQTMIGIGAYLEGYDPNQATILNPADKSGCELLMKHGFRAITTVPVENSLINLLSTYGPLIVIHDCKDFSYGVQHPAMTSGGHAVVITGIDINRSLCWFNNPWGDKDQSVSTGVVLQAIAQRQKYPGEKPIAYLP